MPSPFPGMDPYLERKGLWSEVHHDLITDIRRSLARQMSPKYRIAIDRANYSVLLSDVERVGDPDVIIYERANPPRQHGGVAVLDIPLAQPKTIRLPMPFDYEQGFLEIRELGTEKVITVIEVLSHANKNSRRGRQQYLKKRDQILQSRTNLVEIDLLRAGHSPLGELIEVNSYSVVVSRSWQRPRADLYAFGVREPIPAFVIPLRENEPEIPLDLNRLVATIYDAGGYGMAIDYSQPPTPRLRESDAEWAQKIVPSQEA